MANITEKTENGKLVTNRDQLVVMDNIESLKQPKENKSKEAVETNKDIEQLLLSIQKAFDVLVEKRTDLPVLTIRGVTTKSFID